MKTPPYAFWNSSHSEKDIEAIRHAAKQSGIIEGLAIARIIAAAVGPCSGTKDWNDSRMMTIKHIDQGLLSELTKRKKELEEKR